ncbi:hypothetical protein D3C71_1134890 [compost metagenome]
MIGLPGDEAGFAGDMRSSDRAPSHCDDHRQVARYSGADQLTGPLPGRTHTLAETQGLAGSRSQGNWTARVGRYGVIGDNRGTADDRCIGLSDSVLPRGNLQGRAIRAQLGQHCGNTFAPTLGGEHSMINNVYLGRSQ